MRPPCVTEKESVILLALYGVERGTYTTHTLASKLNLPFTETRDATEGLIGRGFVAGEHHAGADGVYFNKLRLTAKGVRTAIHQQRNSQAFDIETVIEEIEKALT